MIASEGWQPVVDISHQGWNISTNMGHCVFGGLVVLQRHTHLDNMTRLALLCGQDLWLQNNRLLLTSTTNSLDIFIYRYKPYSIFSVDITVSVSKCIGAFFLPWIPSLIFTVHPINYNVTFLRDIKKSYTYYYYYHYMYKMFMRTYFIDLSYPANVCVNFCFIPQNIPFHEHIKDHNTSTNYLYVDIQTLIEYYLNCTKNCKEIYSDTNYNLHLLSNNKHNEYRHVFLVHFEMGSFVWKTSRSSLNHIHYCFSIMCNDRINTSNQVIVKIQYHYFVVYMELSQISCWDNCSTFHAQLQGMCDFCAITFTIAHVEEFLDVAPHSM